MPLEVSLHNRSSRVGLLNTNQKLETGYLLQHEWPTYCFDGLLMAIVLGVCLQWHVGKVTPRFDPISQTAEYPLDNEHP